MLFLKLLVAVPFLERLVDLISTNLEHSLGISTTSLLQAPSRRVVEGKTASAWARVLLLEVVSHLKAREGLSLRPKSVTAGVVLLDTEGFSKVLSSILI